MFQNYSESGPALLSDPNSHALGKFTLTDTSTTVANTLRRCILADTRSVGFRADLTNSADPGVVIRKNTSVIFNEMLAHRLTLLPLAVRNIDSFDPSRYECVLSVKNERKGMIESNSLLHVKAGDFRVFEKQEDGSFAPLGLPVSSEMFPADPITKDTSLLVSLRPQWNPEQPPEEVDLTAYPVIGTGKEHMGFCPVSQCSFENTRDDDPVRKDQFFNEWLASFKKITDTTAISAEQMADHKAEWNTLGVQRCFQVDERGEPNSFGFTVESVGVRPVQEIVAEGIRAAATLVTPYADTSKSAADLGITTQPADSRMNGLDVFFDGQEHTLGNLLQTLITELYLDEGALDSPITYVGYRIRHPLQRIMMLRFGFRDGVEGDRATIAYDIIAKAAERAMAIFAELERSWAAVTGGEVAPPLTLEG